MSTPSRDSAVEQRRAEALSAWLDGELGEAEAAELEAELARDGELQAELAQLEGVVRLLREEGPEQAPLNFHHQLMARIEAEEAASPVARAGSWFSRWFGLRWETAAMGLAAAAALLVVVPAGSWLSRGESPPEDVQTSPGIAAPPTESSFFEGRGVREAPPEPTRVSEKLLPPAPVVIGRATTGTAKVAEVTTGTPTGTAEEELAVATELALPDPMTDPAPPAAVAPGTADEAELRTVVRSTDPAMKRQVLGVAARFGAVTDAAGRQVTSGVMASSREDLIVRVPPEQLAAFQQELVALGLTVRSTAPTDLVPAGPVAVHLSLQLGGDGGTAEPEATPAARDAIDVGL